MERLWFYFFLSPPFVAGPQKPQKLSTSKIKYEHFGQKFYGYFGALIFQEIDFFEHLKCNFKTS